MRRTLRIWIPMVWLLLAVAPASAQEFGDRLRSEVERTTELLSQVASRVKEANDPRANALFTRAESLQSEAVQLLQAAEDATNPTIARGLAQKVLALTLRARELGQQATRILRDSVGLQERAARVIEQASNLWERIHDASSSPRGPRVRTILEESRRQLDAARNHYADHQFEIALRLGESALDLLTPLRDGGAPDPGDRLESLLERARVWLERAQSQVDEFSPAQLQQLQRAQGLWERAHQAHLAGNGELSQHLLRQLRDLLGELRIAADTEINAEDVRRAAERFDAEAGRLREVLADHGNEPVDAVRLLERAVDERAAAVEAAGKGQFEEALRRLRGALDMLSRARRMLGVR